MNGVPRGSLESVASRLLAVEKALAGLLGDTGTGVPGAAAQGSESPPEAQAVLRESVRELADAREGLQGFLSRRSDGVEETARDLSHGRADPVLESFGPKSVAFFLASAVRAANVGLFSWDLASGKVWYSEEWKRQLGFSRQEVGNDLAEWERRVHPEDLPGSLVNVRSLLESGRTDSHDNFRMRHRDGSWRWIQSHASVVRDDDGRPVRIVGAHVDGTDVLEAREAGSAAEADRRAAVEMLRLQHAAMPIACILVSPNLTVLDWNPAAERIFGYSAAEAIGRPKTELTVPPDRAASFRAFVAELLRDGRPSVARAVNQTKDGRKIVCEWHDTPVFDDSGRAVGVLSMARDVTEMVRLETESARLGRIVEDSLGEVYVFDAGTLRFRSVNHGAAANLGYTREELLLLTPLDLKPEFTPEAFEELLAPLRTGEVRLRRFETSHQRKDGSRYPIEVLLQASEGEGDPVFVAIIQDIGDRRRAEEEQRLGQELTTDLLALSRRTAGDERELSQLAIDAAVRLTRSTIGYLHVVHDDEVHLDLFAWSSGVKEECRIPAADPYPMSAAGVWAEALRQRRPIIHNDYPSLPGRHGYPEGHPHLLRHASVPVFDDDGRVVMIAGVGNSLRPYDERDTGRLQVVMHELWRLLAHRRAEENVKRLAVELEARVTERTAELENANRELESFSYSISHDLRAPLRAMDGFGQILLEDYSADLDADGRSHVERIRASARRMGQLVDDLLRLSRISRAELTKEDVDLSALAEGIGAELAVAEPGRVVRLSVSAGLRVRADPSLLKILLENLLRNAWKFTSRLEEAHVWVEGSGDGGNPLIQVRDDGAGFDRAHARSLFKPFHRLHRPDEFDGTGIGLAIVERIVRRHGGHVEADGVPGRGATIRFRLGEAPAAETR
ncbi:MAG: PAS domain S-box protein [Holophagales bacterium]|nr:PAS domain S-box protein [Holophagales bacterium]